MKQVKMTLIPTCDFCKEKPAKYDAPTVMGPWANMCEDCFPANSVSFAKEIGNELVQKNEPATPKDDGKIYKAIEVHSIEDIICDVEMREVECPQCGESKTVETDADYIWTCEGCGVKVKVEDIIMGA